MQIVNAKVHVDDTLRIDIVVDSSNEDSSAVPFLAVERQKLSSILTISDKFWIVAKGSKTLSSRTMLS